MMADGTREKAAWIARVLGIAISSPAGEGLAAWQAARQSAVATINALAGGIAKLDIPERDEALVLLRAIRANLTEAPTTSRQVDELRRYLETDDIVAEAEAPNGFGIEVRLREPLLAALSGLAPGDAA